MCKGGASRNLGLLQAIANCYCTPTRSCHLSTLFTHLHLPHFYRNYLVPICHPSAHEEFSIGSSLDFPSSPTPAPLAISTALVSNSAFHCSRVAQCTATTSRATFFSEHGKLSTKSATSSLTTKNSPPPSSLRRNHSRCACENSFALVSFTDAPRLVKAEAGGLKSDFTLRRFNVDISKGACHGVIKRVQHEYRVSL